MSPLLLRCCVLGVHVVTSGYWSGRQHRAVPQPVDGGLFVRKLDGAVDAERSAACSHARCLSRWSVPFADFWIAGDGGFGVGGW